MPKVERKESILIIEDDPDMTDLLCRGFRKQGYEVCSAANASEGLQLADTRQPSLIILDITLAYLDGFEVLRRLKGSLHTSGIPVIMLSGRGDVESRLQGFELGADDFVVKPFSMRELIYRIRSILRRKKVVMKTLVNGPMMLDPIALRVTLRGASLDLSLVEFKLLALLMSRSGEILSREELLESVWGHDVHVDPRTVDTCIYRLRGKLGEHGRMMKTVRGRGYCISPEQEKTLADGDERLAT